MLLYYLVTPTLGCLRNYVKYKNINTQMFLRTPISYVCIHWVCLLYCGYSNIWRTMMFERWFFFIYKTCLSLYRNDYLRNKEKYIKKYGITYSNTS